MSSKKTETTETVEPVKPDKPVEAEKPAKETPAKESKKRDFSFTQNREASWLQFDNRVLDEAFDEEVPLFERLKFCEIFGSNLDEWFMIRVGGLSDLAALKKQPRDIRSNQTPAEQLDMIFDMLPAYIERHQEATALVESKLAEKGLTRVTRDALTDADLTAVSKHFDRNLAPIISPLVVDPRHPLPNLRNGRLYVACSLANETESGLLGVIEVPRSAERVVALPSTDRNWRFTLVEDVLIACLDRCFQGFVPKKAAALRVTRNADVDPDGEGIEEEEDYRQHMKKVLKRRLRLQPVRLEIQGTLDPKLEALVADDLRLEPRRIFHVTTPLGMGYVYGLESKIPAAAHAALVFRHFEPQPSPMVDLSRPIREQVEDHDILLTYPYESMTPLLRLVREASADDHCISIKITLYRVAKSSHLCESLIQAAESGKDVTVLMELRARFDEENNIAWADRLEDAGCTVIYGSEGFKCHSKICQLTFHQHGAIQRITCLGTGNFNEKTAKLYSDFMLLTAHEGIADDGNAFFRNLTLGNLRGTYNFLGVAPAGLKPLVMRGINREIQRARDGEPAQLFMKMNSLTDRDVIDKISEACEAGVTVIMVVRGICCIKANVPGKTDGLIIRQIVGRFLEHARIYAFGVEADTVYLSSADMMTRNTERRVEIAFPVLDPMCRSMIVQFANLQLIDNVKASQLTSDGTWKRLSAADGEPRINSQETLLAYAYRRAHEAQGAADVLSPISKTIAPVSREFAGRVLELPSIGSYDAESISEATEDEGQGTAEEMGVDVPELASVEAAAAKPEPEPDYIPSAAAITDDDFADDWSPEEEAALAEAAAGEGRFARAARLFGEAFGVLFGK